MGIGSLKRKKEKKKQQTKTNKHNQKQTTETPQNNTISCVVSITVMWNSHVNVNK